MNRSLLILSVLAGAGLLSFAQEAPSSQAPGPRTAKGEEHSFSAATADGFSHPVLIQVQMELVETSLEKAAELLLIPAPTADAGPLREELRKLTKAGEAKLLDLQLLTGRSGEKCLAQSIQEFTYPTEYEPPELPGEVDVPDKPGGLSPGDLEALDRLITPATPTSFETRNLGGTFEMEPTLSTRQSVSLRFSPNLTWHTGNTVWGERKDSLGNVALIQMPVMYTLRLETALTLKPGQPVLAATLSPKDSEGKTDLSRKVMVFVKVDLLEVK